MSSPQQLVARASKVFPGGKFTRWPLMQTAYAPKFLERGEGSRVWDTEGTPYVDYMCGFGASVLGYAHPEVEAAAAAQAAKGTTLTGPTERSIELAERLVGLRPGASWAILAKNGTDATSAAKVAARAATGRRTILREAARPAGHDEPYWAYHGAQQWLRGAAGVLPDESSDLEAGYQFNDLESVRVALEATDGDCAAIFVGGASYPYSSQTVMPTPEFARGLRALATEHGALLVLDEIRTNFRVGSSVAGGHWSELGDPSSPDGADVAPDMHCICKAVANGHPISALVGNEAAREGAAMITASGTFWLSGGPMSAALATLDILQADESAAMSHMQAMGGLLTDGIASQAANYGVDITVSGPPAMPFVTFDADDASPATRPISSEWCAAVAEGGSWVHPFHNWYLSLSHSQTDIEETLDATEAAFKKITGR